MTKKTCRLCCMESNKESRKTEDIKEFDGETSEKKLLKHYSLDHGVDPKSKCEECGKKFISLRLNWRGEPDYSEIDLLRRVFCDGCGDDTNPLKKLYHIKVEK